MGRRLFSTLFWVFLAVSSVLLFVAAALLWAVTAPFDRRRVVQHRFTCWWASLYTWLNPWWPVTITGREKIELRQTYVMVANHLSLLDILVLFRLRRHFAWVSKVENFRVPFIGWNMRFARYVPLKRGDRASVQAMLKACGTKLEQGTSIMMFPEGTRSRTGELQAFKPGAFELALRMGVPIYVEEAVLAEAGLLIPDESDEEGSGALREDEVEKFKEFLDSVSPDDFKAT